MIKVIASKKPIAYSAQTHLIFVAALLLVLQFIFAQHANAQGDLLLMPRRIVFEGAKRYEELNLANTGKDTARYAISMMHVRMNEDGGFQEIAQPGPGENFADPFIRFFPHSVVLAPGESQVVKIQLNRSSELTAGEYRSHLYFRALPPEMPRGENFTAPDSGISIKLVPVFGISIPVIIRVGEINTQVTVAATSVEMNADTIPVLNMSFRREGTMSVYGDIDVQYISPQGKTIPAGSVNGVAVYTPNTNRRMKLNLNTTRGIDFHNGKLHIIYKTPVESKPATLAETDLVLH